MKKAEKMVTEAMKYFGFLEDGQRITLEEDQGRTYQMMFFLVKIYNKGKRKPCDDHRVMYDTFRNQVTLIV